jgi:hypothetical protein
MIMSGAPAVGGFIAFWGFWALLILGWMIGELDVRRAGLFIGLWVAGRVASGYFLDGHLFTPYLAVLDIALVFVVFKGDVRLG